MTWVESSSALSESPSGFSAWPTKWGAPGAVQHLTFGSGKTFAFARLYALTELQHLLPFDAYVGTGGSMFASGLTTDCVAGTNWRVKTDRLGASDSASPRFESTGDAVAFIRSMLSLNVSETARALRVERPTIYAWISGDVVPHASNLHRLNQLVDVARRWLRHSTAPIGADVRVRNEHNVSLATLLQEDPLPEAQIDKLMEEVRNIQRSRNRHVPASEVAARRGIRVRPERGSGGNVARLTGSRLAD